MNSIKLSYEEWDRYQMELDPRYKGERPISMKMKANGIKPHGSGLYMKSDGEGLIISDGPLDKEEILKHNLLKAMDKRVKGPDFPEVMNIFNELIGAWALDAKVLVGLQIGHKAEYSQIEYNIAMKRINEKRDEYEREFKKALGVNQ